MTVQNFTRFLNPCSRFLYRKPRFLFCQTVYKPAKISNLGGQTLYVFRDQYTSFELSRVHDPLQESKANRATLRTPHLHIMTSSGHVDTRKYCHQLTGDQSICFDGVTLKLQHGGTQASLNRGTVRWIPWSCDHI